MHNYQQKTITELTCRELAFDVDLFSRLVSWDYDYCLLFRFFSLVLFVNGINAAAEPVVIKAKNKWKLVMTGVAQKAILPTREKKAFFIRVNVY